MELENKKGTIINFKEELERFTNDVTQLISNAFLSDKEDFLERISRDVNNLYASANHVLKCEQEEVEEVGSIIKNIFIQPLDTGKKHITFLKAASEYPMQKGSASDLSDIMRQYVQHPETTRSFLRELQLLTEDVETALVNIA